MELAVLETELKASPRRYFLSARATSWSINSPGWMGISIQGYPVMLERLKSLLVEQARILIGS
jgi:hypothetical protein